MSTETEKQDSNVSSSELDGNDAEMDIGMEENTEANSANKSDEAPLKEYPDSLTEKESAGSPEEDGNDTNAKETVEDNNSMEMDQESSPDVANQPKKLRGRPQKNQDKETDKSNSNEEKDPESSNEVPDQAKRLRGRPKKNQDKKESDDNEEKALESSKEVTDQTKKLRGRPKKNQDEEETIQFDGNEEKDPESSNEVPDDSKKSRGRPKKNQDKEETIQFDDNEEKDPESSNEVPNDSKKPRGRPKKNLLVESESNKKDTRQSKDDSKEKSVDADSRQSRARTSTLKSKLGDTEVTSSLKRSNKSAVSSPEEEGEVPQKKLRSSSKDNTPKRSTNLSPDTTEAVSTTRKNLRARPTPKDTPTASKTTPALNKLKSSDAKSNDNLKPVPPVLKAWTLDPIGISNLNSFPVIKKRVQKAELRFIKSLHQVLYNKELAKDAPGKQFRKEILDFQGFSFKKPSAEFRKHKNLFEKMPESTISQISNILDMKNKNISKIMEFLLQPSKIIYCEVDPLHPSMQPELKLQKISLENFPEDASSEDDSSCEIFSSSEDTVVTGKRKRFPSTKLRFYESEFEVSSLKKEPKEPERYSSITIKPRKGLVPIAPKRVIPQVQSAKKTSVPKTKQTSRTPAKTPVDRKMKIVKRPVSSDINVRRKALELALQIQGEVEPSALEASTNEGSSMDSLEYDTDIKQEMVTDEESEEKESAGPKDENSSEDTLSADEGTFRGTQKVKRLYKTPAIPLRTYPTIKENVLKADVGTLRRLHILLFGASDKESNLGGNILAFGGFPFYKGSEEWKRKEFLLSLLSQSTLKEYLDILDIKYPEGNNNGILIKKLMNFLVVPIEKSPVDIEDDNEADSDMEIVTTDQLVPLEDDELPGKLPVIKNVKFLKKKPEVQKKPVKKPELGKGYHKRRRKVLMDEAQVRRLEADLAREQRILEREKKLHEQQVKKLDPSIKYNATKTSFEIPKSQVLKVGTASQADEEMLNALMETVYQRRELKKAGAKVSVPNKGGHTRLGELANVKFLVVTANFNDLDVLHHLIYMTEAVKGRVRKNILDFAGFNFTEESPAYQDRMNFLRSLGYDISRRIAFLLGLCPFKTLIAQQDLNELIMYFLMSPCQASQVPIRDLPTTFFGNEMPVELSALVKKHISDVPGTPAQPSKKPMQPIVSKSQPGQSQTTIGQKAKKSFRSSFVSSKMQNLQPSISTLPLKAPEKLLQPTIFPQNQSQIIKTLNIPTGQAQEIFIQQQTTDGQQKTFKLVKLPENHPLMASIKSQTQQQAAASTPTPQPITITAPPVIGAPPGLPPGLIVFKNNPTNPALSSVMQTVPLGIGQSAITSVAPKTTRLLLPKLDDSGPVIASVEGGAEGVLPKEKDSDVSVEGEYGADEPEELAGEPDPLDEEEGPPTDDDIYGAIQDIIHSCPSLEDITLRNVITRVSAKYPNYDLSPQHYFMKECVKKIIMGT